MLRLRRTPGVVRGRSLRLGGGSLGREAGHGVLPAILTVCLPVFVAVSTPVRAFSAPVSGPVLLNPLNYGFGVDGTSVEDLARERFVSLTTFRRSGEPVSTPMWIASDGVDLLMWTPADSWKVRRLADDPRVRLAPCSRAGKVREAAPPVVGTAVVISDPDAVDRAAQTMRRKYGWEFRIVTALERIVARGRRPRVALQITLR